MEKTNSSTSILDTLSGNVPVKFEHEITPSKGLIYLAISIMVFFVLLQIFKGDSK